MKLLNALLIGFLILIIFVSARNTIIRIGLEHSFRMATGLKLDIQALDIGLLKPTVSIKRLQLYNPGGYKELLMAEVEEIYFRYRMGDLLKGHISLNELRLSLSSISIIRLPGHQLNVDALKGIQPHGNGAPPAFIIDDFILNIGKVIYKDFTQSPPLLKDFDINLKDHYINIHDANALERLIMISVLRKTSIAASLKMDINKLKDGLSGTLFKSLQFSGDSIKGLFNI